MQGLSRNLQGQGQDLTGPQEKSAGVKVRIWDLPTRAVHWLLALLIPFSWWSANSDHLPWHRLSGYTILGLLIFRLIWGVVGSATARFSGFLRGPGVIVAYLRGRMPPTIGHNPLGGWSIAAMFTALGVQLALGLFSVDEDGLEAGPLSKFVSFDTGRAIAHAHHIGFWALLALISLHLTAIAVYAMRRRNLVSPMITGVANVGPGQAAPPLAARWRAAPVAAVAVAVTWIVAHGFKL
jgi:cytochrome b